MYEQTVNFGVTLTYLVYFLVKSYLNRKCIVYFRNINRYATPYLTRLNLSLNQASAAVCSDFATGSDL